MTFQRCVTNTWGRKKLSTLGSSGSKGTSNGSNWFLFYACSRQSHKTDSSLQHFAASFEIQNQGKSCLVILCGWRIIQSWLCDIMLSCSQLEQPDVPALHAPALWVTAWYIVQEMQSNALLKTHNLKFKISSQGMQSEKSKLSGGASSHFCFSFHYCLCRILHGIVL